MIFGYPEREHIPKITKELLYNKQKGKCNYCGNKFQIRYFHIDHKTPISRGGSSTSISNMQLLCGPCNNRKGKLTDGEFRRKYKLPGSRSAKGPPARPRSQEYFERIDKDVAVKKAAKKKRENEWGWL